MYYDYHKYILADEDGITESMAVLEKLEKIDTETDNMDITFVKMSDPRYARKWGVTKLPSVVYFRNRFPSIYRGKLLFCQLYYLLGFKFIIFFSYYFNCEYKSQATHNMHDNFINPYK